MNSDFIQAQEAPWRYGFLNLMRRVDVQFCAAPAGSTWQPRMEKFRLGQVPTLTFAPREIAQVSWQEGRLHLSLYSLGLWGPNGPLPLHYTELALNRTESRRDPTLTRFSDLFHHRWLTQFYQAWRSAQSAGGGLDKPEYDRFAFYIASLSGQDLRESAASPLPDHVRLAASSHLVRESRNPDGLVATLAHYFDVPFRIQEFVLHWIDVANDEITLLGAPAPSSVIGNGALIGQAVPDMQYKFRLVIGPLTLADYQRFLPGGNNLPVLTELVRTFTGFEYIWEIELQLKPHAAPPAIIGGSPQLGWTAWSGKAMNDDPMTGMIFELECYLTH
ncbi:TPA: type VI secretion system baseplate subunit TssG [Citrobacter freundii]|nr:type VI secretion system baseplate subunit TssG [Citrobacter freundii]HEM8626759.1 type VI secretion system baseplate subunit TssG [Citrobacter farmeri]HAT2288641.1 type VI secretion system baseplate subunit TssG [Citrobacter freundii]HAT2351651.1 type VI secretion system baseplate subunit TssG [Citrobacter freundii]HAT2352760.1 type VI secretion system baseplate subunit TssG [Citrobacter freundii]